MRRCTAQGTNARDLMAEQVLRRILSFLSFLRNDLFTNRINRLNNQNLTFRRLTTILLTTRARRTTDATRATRRRPRRAGSGRRQRRQNRRVHPGTTLLRNHHPTLSQVDLLCNLSRNYKLHMHMMRLRIFTMILRAPNVEIYDKMITLGLRLSLLNIICSLYMFGVITIRGLRAILNISNLKANSNRGLRRNRNGRYRGRGPRP